MNLFAFILHVRGLLLQQPQETKIPMVSQGPLLLVGLKDDQPGCPPALGTYCALPRRGCGPWDNLFYFLGLSFLICEVKGGDGDYEIIEEGGLSSKAAPWRHEAPLSYTWHPSGGVGAGVRWNMGRKGAGQGARLLWGMHGRTRSGGGKPAAQTASPLLWAWSQLAGVGGAGGGWGWGRGLTAVRNRDLTQREREGIITSSPFEIMCLQMMGGTVRIFLQIFFFFLNPRNNSFDLVLVVLKIQF